MTTIFCTCGKCGKVYEDTSSQKVIVVLRCPECREEEASNNQRKNVGYMTTCPYCHTPFKLDQTDLKEEAFDSQRTVADLYSHFDPQEAYKESKEGASNSQRKCRYCGSTNIGHTPEHLDPQMICHDCGFILKEEAKK